MGNRENETRDNSQNKNEQSGNSFLLGAFIGGVVGAAAALLFSPKSGSEIRSKINEQTGMLLDKTVDLRETVVNKGSQLAAKTTSLTQELIQQSADLLNKTQIMPKNTGEKNEKTEGVYIPLTKPQENDTNEGSSS